MKKIVINVLVLTGSLNNIILIEANTIIPIANPINLLGHISPLKLYTNASTDFIYNQLIGIAIPNINNGYLSYQLYFMFPCNCRNVSTCAMNP